MKNLFEKPKEKRPRKIVVMPKKEIRVATSVPYNEYKEDGNKLPVYSKQISEATENANKLFEKK